MTLKAGSSARSGATGFTAIDEGNALFGPDSVSEISNVVQVDDEPIIVRAHHLGPGERVRVELVDGNGAGEHIGPYMRAGCAVALTRKCNQWVLAIPGRYRFVLENAVPGVPYVRYFRASMTHEFLLENASMGVCDEFPACLPPCGPAGGDLEGTYPNPQVNALQVAERLVQRDSALTLLAEALCAAMQACIGAAAQAASVHVTAVNFNAVTQVLSIQSSDGAVVQTDLSVLMAVYGSDGLTGAGTQDSPLRVRLSTLAGNGLSLEADGLYARAEASPTSAPALTDADSLPTHVYGGRAALLGAPVGWVEVGPGRKVPYWQ